MKRSLYSTIISVSLIYLLSVTALTAEAPAPMSLQNCIDAALVNNADILTAKNGVITSKNRLTAAKSEYFPQVSVQNNMFTWSSSDTLSSAQNRTALTVSQNIYDGGIRETGVEKSYQGTIQSSANLARLTQTINYNVSRAYYEVLRSRKLQEVAVSNEKYNEGLREQILARAEVGDAARTDVLPVEAQLASAKVNLLSAQNTLRNSLIQLQSEIGLQPQPGFDVLEAESIADHSPDTLENYLAQAKDSRPDIKYYRAGTEAAKATASAAKIALNPRPFVVAEYQKDITGSSKNGGSQIYGGFVFDLFDGGSNKASYDEAKTNQENAQIQEMQLLKDIHLQVEEAYLNLFNARERMAASQVSLEASNKNYQVQQERYAQGLSTALDLLNAEVQAVTAQSDDVQARYDYYIALAQMDYAVGK